MRRLYPIALFALVLVFAGQSCVSFGGSSDDSTSGPAGMFVSTNQGEAWTQIAAMPTADGVVDVSSASVYEITADPQDPAALYWSTREKGLLYSYNNGKTWSRAPAPLDTGFIYSVAVHPKEKCTLYVTEGQFIYKSNDCSRSWKEVYRETTPGASISSIAINIVDGVETIFFLKNSGKLVKSTDDGANWSVTGTFSSGIRSIVADPLQPGVLYVVHKTKGLYRSTDNGATWKTLDQGFKKYSGALNMRRFLLHPYKLDNIYWISDYGILLSEDGGTSWQPFDLLTDPGSVKIYGFAVNPKHDEEIYYTATVGTRSTMYRTLDGGNTWTTKKLPSGQIPTAMYVNPEQTNLLYVGFTIPPKQ